MIEEIDLKKKFKIGDLLYNKQYGQIFLIIKVKSHSMHIKSLKTGRVIYDYVSEAIPLSSLIHYPTL